MDLLTLAFSLAAATAGTVAGALLYLGARRYPGGESWKRRTAGEVAHRQRALRLNLWGLVFLAASGLLGLVAALASYAAD